MYLILYILFLVILLNLLSVKEPFVSDKSIVSTIMNTTPKSVLEGMYKKIHPLIPFKNRYYKLRRHLRSK